MESSARLWQRWHKLWPLLLAAVYVALIPLLAGLEDVRGVNYLLGASAVACLLIWYVRYNTDPRGFLDTGKELLEAISDWRYGRERAASKRPDPSAVSLPVVRQRPHSRWARLLVPPGLGIGALRSLPSIVLWLPLPVSLAWVGATMARVHPAEADYDLAFGLWVVALVLFVAVFLVPLAVENWGKLPMLVRAIPWPEVATVAFITGVAFAVRFIDLADAPGPLWNDEGLDGSKGLEIQEGFRKNLLEMGFGSEVSEVYYATLALSFKLFGVSIQALRLPSTIIGTATVFLFYFLLREMFDRRVALVGAAFLAVYHFHVHFTRIAFHNGYDAFFAILVLLFAFRAIRTGALVDFALAGLASGLLFYFFSGARLVPVVLVLLLALMVVKTRGTFVLRNFWGLAVLLAGFVVSFLPAGLYFNEFPDRFSSRFEAQSILGSGWLEAQMEITGHSELHIIWDQVQHAFGALVVYDDVFQHYNAGIPLLTGVSSVFFVIGGVYALFHIFQPRFFALFSLLVLVVVLLGALVGPPVASQRYLGTVPVSGAFVALGVVVGTEAVANVMPRLRPYAPVLMGALVLLIAFVNLNFYFGTYVPSDNYGRGRHLALAQVADYLEAFDDDYTVYFLSAGGFNVRDGGLRFRARDKVLVDVWESGEMRNTYVGGSNFAFGEEAAAARKSKSNALFLVPTARSTEFLRIREECPNGVKSELLTTPNGLFPYLWYEVPSAQGCLDRLQGIVLGKTA